jgi:peptidoglycan/xylan/chitin deacetylase (PgdA/CDA1 family)
VSGVPILCYHNVALRPAGTRFGLLYVGPDAFDRQLWALRRLGLRGVSLGEALPRLRDHARSNMVALTFDDGYLDTLTEAAPLLARYGFRATCYLVSDRLGDHNAWDDGADERPKALMTRAQIGRWLESGMEIASHSCTHPRLHEIDDAEAVREIVDSRDALRREFGVAVDDFAYPFGAFNARTADLVRAAGYRSAVTTRPGIARGSDDPLRLHRLLVDGQRGLWRFLLQVATPFEDVRARRKLAD